MFLENTIFWVHIFVQKILSLQPSLINNVFGLAEGDKESHILLENLEVGKVLLQRHSGKKKKKIDFGQFTATPNHPLSSKFVWVGFSWFCSPNIAEDQWLEYELGSITTILGLVIAEVVAWKLRDNTNWSGSEYFIIRYYCVMMSSFSRRDNDANLNLWLFVQPADYTWVYALVEWKIIT